MTFSINRLGITVPETVRPFCNALRQLRVSTGKAQPENHLGNITLWKTARTVLYRRPSQADPVLQQERLRLPNRDEGCDAPDSANLDLPAVKRPAFKISERAVIRQSLNRGGQHFDAAFPADVMEISFRRLIPTNHEQRPVHAAVGRPMLL